jgi:hypothetical protein
MLFELQPIFINMKNLEKKNPWNIKKLVQFFKKQFVYVTLDCFLSKGGKKFPKKRKELIYMYVCMYVHQLLMKV